MTGWLFYSPQGVDKTNVLLYDIDMSVSLKSEAARFKLYGYSLQFLSTDASPKDQAPDEVGCADTASYLIIGALGPVIKHTVSTADLFNQLNKSPNFKRVTAFEPGCIVISPTVIGKQPGKLTNGHVGIVGEANEILSNDSRTGLLIQNFTVDSWVARYRALGKYPIYVFKPI